MVVGYLRVSTEKQHLSNQQDEILRFAQTRNMEIDRWVTEVVSGKKDQKDRKLGSILRRLKNGDTLIVTEISRLSRTLTEIVWIKGLPFIRPRTVMPLTIRSTVKSCALLSVSWRRSNGT